VPQSTAASSAHGAQSMRGDAATADGVPTARADAAPTAAMIDIVRRLKVTGRPPGAGSKRRHRKDDLVGFGRLRLTCYRITDMP
jgi:hypothetical protein